VTDQINARRNREEREERQRVSIDWMRETLQAGERVDVPEEMSDLVRRVEDWIFRPAQRGEELEDWLRRAGGNMEADEGAYRLLLLTGRVTDDDDRFLILAGIREGFASEVIAACDELTPYEVESSRTDFASLVCFTIDDADTREVDDALTVEETDEGTRVGIHIADVAHFVELGGVLDQEAFSRGATMYLPSRSVTMFPERLSCDLASLDEGELRPTMSFIVDFDRDGAITAERIERGQVRVTHRLDYHDADERIRSDDDDELARALRRLDEISAALLARRCAKGALMIRRPELRVRARKDEPIQLEVLFGDSPSRRVVSELMILSNSVAAGEARRRSVPIIYRTQDPPRDDVKVPEDYDPVALEGVFRSLSRSQLSTHARAHSGLGLDCYTQMTSPIRRLADLVMQRQFAAHLSGDPPPYDTEELFRVLATAGDVEKAARRVEEQANRFAVLDHLEKERLDDEFEAILVGRHGPVDRAETTDLFIRGQLSGAGHLSPGDRLSVRIDKIDPLRGRLDFRPVE
jgi:exoribonuclease-2